MKILNILTISMILSGCGNSSFTAVDETGSEAGANNEAGAVNDGGKIDDIAGNAGISGNSSSVGGNEENGGSSGSLSIGGSAGSISMNMAGSGGLPNIAGMNFGGTGGMENNCKPITCDSYSLDKAKTAGLSCGSMDDGCGHMLDCGNCNSHSNCGGNSIKLDPSNSNEMPKTVVGVPNICTDSCIQSYYSSDQICQNDTSENPKHYVYYVSCSMDFTDPPKTDCVKITEQNQSLYTSTWCCVSTYK